MPMREAVFVQNNNNGFCHTGGDKGHIKNECRYKHYKCRNSKNIVYLSKVSKKKVINGAQIEMRDTIVPKKNNKYRC